MLVIYRYFIAVSLVFSRIAAFSCVGETMIRTTKTAAASGLFSGATNDDAATDSFADCNVVESLSSRTFEATGSSSRRRILKGAIATAGGVAAPNLLFNPSTASAAEQRCDAVDPRCGADGVLRDTIPKGKPIPRVTNKITHVVQLVIDVGERREEVGFLRFGLYGDDCPKTVRTMLEFLTPIGITGLVTEKTEDLLENSIGMQTSPVSILQGGIVPEICPGNGIEFGVPSQQKAYARSRGLQMAGKNFVPQNRPEMVSLTSEPSARKHDAAGLVSIPEKGIGYAVSGGDIDGAFSSAFLVTADANPDLDDKLHRRVIGQLIDDDSMEFLARLSSLPIQKKGSGGKGPPLLKVSVLDVGVQKIGASNQQKKKK